MVPALPVELCLFILNAVVEDVDDSSYFWPPMVRMALLSLSQVDRRWRSIATGPLYQRLVIHSAHQIAALLSLPRYLYHTESLALLPGPWQYSRNSVANPGHAFCADDLWPLLGFLAPTLKRLFIMHQHRDEPRCSRWPHTIAGLSALQELVVDHFEGIFPPRLVTISAPEASPGTRLPGTSAGRGIPRSIRGGQSTGPGYSTSSRPSTGSETVSIGNSASPLSSDSNSDGELDNDDPHRILPSWPFMPSVRRLVTSGHSLTWRDYKYADYFPLIERLVFVDYGWIEDAPSQIRSMGRQLRHNHSLQVVIVEEERPYLRRDWQDDVQRLPADQFLFHLYDASETNGARSWLVQHAVHGGLFDVGSAFSDLRASTEP